MSRLVSVGVFLLILASVVDGSSSSSRRSSRIISSPSTSMSELLKRLYSVLREPATGTEESDNELLIRESAVLNNNPEACTVSSTTEPTTEPPTTEPTTEPTTTEPSTQPTTTEPSTEPTTTKPTTEPSTTTAAPLYCIFSTSSYRKVKQEVIYPEIHNVTSSNCTDTCDKDESCISVEAYNVDPIRCILNMGVILDVQEDEATCSASCMDNPACVTAYTSGTICQHYNRGFPITEVQTEQNLSNLYMKRCLQSYR